MTRFRKEKIEFLKLRFAYTKVVDDHLHILAYTIWIYGILFDVTDEYVLQPQSEKNEDHPLNPNPDSQWQSFFKDNDVLLQIDKDVRRLCPDINFFSQATDFPNKKIAGLIFVSF